MNLLEKHLDIAKMRKQALRLLKEGKKSLCEVTQVVNADKSIPRRITKCLQRND